MWNRRQFVNSVSSALMAAMLPKAAFGADAFTPLRRNVGTFTGRGGTIGWLVNGDGIAVVDTQFPETAAACWTGLRERSKGPLACVFNTHHHGDHTSGNGTFRPHARRIVAHENVPRLQTEAARRQNRDDVTVADTTFEKEWTGQVGDETISLKYYGPAHTSGDAVIHFRSANVAHVGDLVFNRVPPFIDLTGGASSAGWIGVVEAIHRDFDDETLFIYGHGQEPYGVTGSRADLLVMRDFLSGLREYVGRGLREGKTAAELAGIEVLPGFPEHRRSGGPSLENAVKAVYEELSR